MGVQGTGTRRPGGAAWAAPAEVAWHVLGAGWAFAVLAAGLIWLAGLLPAAMASDKAYALEDRLNALIPKIPAPQPAPGTSASGTASGSNSSWSATNGSYGASNGSYGMGVINATANSGSGNQGGGPSSSTSGQIGGASAHYHDMTHYHTSSADLEGVFNALRDSHSALVPAVNALQGSYSGLVPAFNSLQSSHSSLVPVVNNLISDHAQLITDHNNLKQSLLNSGVLHP